MNDDSLKEALQELYEQAPCGYIFTLPNGTIIRVNQTFLSWTGYTRSELISSMRFQDLLTIPGKIFYENQYAPLLRMQGWVREVAFDLVRNGAEPLPILINSVQRTDMDGRPTMIASTIFDATQRRTYERELLRARQRAEQLAAIVTVANDAILIATTSGVVQTWNAGAERLFGYSESEMIGRSLSEVLTVFGDEAESRRILHELQEEQAVHLETVGLHKSGRHIDISVGVTPHMGELGELSAVSAIIRDIGERRALERLQQEFLAMASHELRNPLAGIKGHAQLMRRRGAYSEEAVEAIVAQANRLGRLIDDLLLASQIEADRLTLRLAEIDLVAEVRAAISQMAIDGASVRLETAVEANSPPIVRADQLRLGQVFANLLTNAVKYSPQGSEVVVRIVGGVTDVRVEVIDQGVGIPPEALPHLFSRFYRVASTAGRAQGLGLGLYISRRIVEAHGGSITLESQPGRGSTFTVTLPLQRNMVNPD